MNLIDRIKLHEGYRRTAYLCPAGKLTIGYGTRIDDGGPGIPAEIADLLVRHEVRAARFELEKLPWWRHLDAVRQDVVVEMVYQMGLAGVLQFRRMVQALSAGNYSLAANEMLDSKWARQDSPARARRLAEVMAKGAE